MNTALGCLVMATASAIVAVNSLLAQLLGGESLGAAPVHPLVTVAARFLFACIAIAIVARLYNVGYTRRNLGLATLRTLCGWGGTLCNFAALALASMGEVTAISFLNPMIAMMLAFYFLGEPVNRLQWGAALVSFAGTMIIIRPDFAALHPAHLLALLCACLWGTETCFIKRLLATGQGRMQILLTNNTIGAVLSCSVAAFVFTLPSGLQAGLLITIALLTLVSQVMIMQALRLADAGIVLPIYYSTLIFAVLLDYLAHAIWPDLFDMTGGLMIIASSVLMSMSKSAGQKRLQAREGRR